MEDVRRVSGRETGTHVEPEAHDVGQRQPPLAGQQRAEHLALDELHREEAVAAVFTDVVRACDVLVRDPTRELHLAAEPLDHVGRRQLLLQDLQRNDLVELAIPRAVDRAHRARAEHPEQLVASREELRRFFGGRSACLCDRERRRNGPCLGISLAHQHLERTRTACASVVLVRWRLQTPVIPTASLRLR